MLVHYTLRSCRIMLDDETGNEPWWSDDDQAVTCPDCRRAAGLALRIDEQMTQDDRLRALVEAAEAVVARWDTPLWKDAEPTARVINRLRAALSALNQPPRETAEDRAGAALWREHDGRHGQAEEAVSVFDPSEPRPARATGEWSDVWAKADAPETDGGEVEGLIERLDKMAALGVTRSEWWLTMKDAASALRSLSDRLKRVESELLAEAARLTAYADGGDASTYEAAWAEGKASGLRNAASRLAIPAPPSQSGDGG